MCMFFPCFLSAIRVMPANLIGLYSKGEGLCAFELCMQKHFSARENECLSVEEESFREKVLVHAQTRRTKTPTHTRTRMNESKTHDEDRDNYNKFMNILSHVTLSARPCSNRNRDCLSVLVCLPNGSLIADLPYTTRVSLSLPHSLSLLSHSHSRSHSLTHSHPYRTPTPCACSWSLTELPIKTALISPLAARAAFRVLSPLLTPLHFPVFQP